MYKGWDLTYSAARPVIGQWEAERFGVVISAGSEDAIKRMVDTRIAERPPTGD